MTTVVDVIVNQATGHRHLPTLMTHGATRCGRTLHAWSMRWTTHISGLTCKRCRAIYEQEHA